MKLVTEVGASVWSVTPGAKEEFPEESPAGKFDTFKQEMLNFDCMLTTSPYISFISNSGCLNWEKILESVE